MQGNHVAYAGPYDSADEAKDDCPVVKQVSPQDFCACRPGRKGMDSYLTRASTLMSVMLSRSATGSPVGANAP